MAISDQDIATVPGVEADLRGRTEQPWLTSLPTKLRLDQIIPHSVHNDLVRAPVGHYNRSAIWADSQTPVVVTVANSDRTDDSFEISVGLRFGNKRDMRVVCGKGLGL